MSDESAVLQLPGTTTSLSIVLATLLLTVVALVLWYSYQALKRGASTSAELRLGPACFSIRSDAQQATQAPCSGRVARGKVTLTTRPTLPGHPLARACYVRRRARVRGSSSIG